MCFTKLETVKFYFKNKPHISGNNQAIDFVKHPIKFGLQLILACNLATIICRYPKPPMWPLQISQQLCKNIYFKSLRLYVVLVTLDRLSIKVKK